MVIDSALANRFIEQYKRFLMYVHGQEMGEDDESGEIKKLSTARNLYLAERERYNAYLDEAEGYDPDIKAAIKSLEVADWAYLEDGDGFSLFVKSNGTLGVAVLGLTQPIKKIFGCSGLYLRTGIVQLGGHFTIDGIISDPTRLSEGYRETYKMAIEKIKQRNGFIEHPQGEGPPSAQIPTE